MKKHEIRIPEGYGVEYNSLDNCIYILDADGNRLGDRLFPQKVEIPEGCEVDSITTEGGSVVVTFKQKENQLPETWVEFCENYPTKAGECYITTTSDIIQASATYGNTRVALRDRDLLPDRATAEAVLALCQLIQLRDCYNQGWVPNWNDDDEKKHMIILKAGEPIQIAPFYTMAYSPLYFKTNELCDQFLGNFRGLIEKLKPLYGIKEDVI